jgi:hypothetical protein
VLSLLLQLAFKLYLAGFLKKNSDFRKNFKVNSASLFVFENNSGENKLLIKPNEFLYK